MAITPLPNAPPLIEGVVNVRGHILPVLDVRARFRLPARPLDPSDLFIVAAAAGGRAVILRVDAATHIAELDDAPADPTRAAYAAGVATLEDGMVLVHDVAAFLTAAEAAAIDAAIDASIGAAA